MIKGNLIFGQPYLTTVNPLGLPNAELNLNGKKVFYGVRDKNRIKLYAFSFSDKSLAKKFYVAVSEMLNQDSMNFPQGSAIYKMTTGVFRNATVVELSD
jgi:hypothetical protein